MTQKQKLEHIGITLKTKKFLDSKKIVPRETYEQVLCRLLNMIEVR